MDEDDEGILRKNALQEVPPPRGESLYGGVYLRVNLNVGRRIYVDYLIVLEGGTMSGNFVGVIYVPEGVHIDTSAAPGLVVKQLPFYNLATWVWRLPSE